MGLWDFYKGFGESFEDWGGSSGNYGLGSINPSAGESFKGLDHVGFPGPMKTDTTGFVPWYRTLDYVQPKQNEAEQLYQYYLRAGRDRTAGMGDMPFGYTPRNMAYLSALGLASGDREGGVFNAQGGFDPVSRPNTSIPLRNAQHGLVGQVAAQNSPLGKLTGLFSVPTYNFAKWLAQSTPRWSGVPQGLDFLGDSYLDSGPNSLTQASPPSWEAIRWGLRPWWGRD